MFDRHYKLESGKIYRTIIDDFHVKKVLIILITLSLLACYNSNSDSKSSSKKHDNSNQETTAPEIISVTPINNASVVSIDITPTVTFSEVMDASTLNASTFILIDEYSNIIDGSVTCNGETAIFAPLTSLSPNASYIATISTDVRDLAGNQMINDYSWSFSIKDAADMFNPYISLPTGSWPEAVAVGDVNNDGKNDVVISTSFYFDTDNDYHVFVFLQNSLGQLTFSSKYLTSGSPETIDVGDINHDGLADIVVGNSGMNIEVFLQKSAGGFHTSVTYQTVNSHKIKIADFNNDGLNDVAGIGWGTDTVDLFLQNVAGTLDAPVTYSVMHGGYDDLDAGDVNNDGMTDLIVMSGQLYANPNIGVLIQKNDGTYRIPAYYDLGGNELTSGVAVGDVNNDSLKDVIVTYGGNQPSSFIGLFQQNNLGTLDLPVSHSSYDCPEPVKIADIDSDGKNDIVVAHGGWNAIGIYYQLSNGALMTEELYAIPYATSYNPHGLSIGDINNDQLNDIVIADYNHGLVVLYHR